MPAKQKEPRSKPLLSPTKITSKALASAQRSPEAHSKRSEANMKDRDFQTQPRVKSRMVEAKKL